MTFAVSPELHITSPFPRPWSSNKAALSITLEFPLIDFLLQPLFGSQEQRGASWMSRLPHRELGN